MPTEQNWKAYEQSASTILTTELNSLADGANAITAEIDNTSTLDMFDDLEIFLASATAARDADAHVKIHVLVAMDGTNYPLGDATLDPVDSNEVYTALFSTGATTQRQVIRGIVLPPAKFKYLFQNETGLAYQDASNTLKRRSYNIKTT